MGKKIAIIIPTLNRGGAERVVSNLSQNLPGSIEKDIILYNAEEIRYPCEGNIINLDFPGTNSMLKKIKSLILRILKVRKIKRKRNITATLSFFENPNIVNILSRQKDKVIISVRNFKSKEKKAEGIYGKIFSLLMRLLYNRADTIIAVSEMVKRDLIKNFNVSQQKIKVIYNPFDIKKINQMMQEEVEDKYVHIFDGPVVITVGRLVEQKGQWHLIRAFKEVKDKIKDVKLVILGEGELESYLKSITSEFGLDNDVLFLGMQENPFKYIKKASLFILPSLFEGFPNSLAEAMACGVPVIACDCMSGPREILAPNTPLEKEALEIEYAANGILVPVCCGRHLSALTPLTCKEKILSSSIIECLTNHDLRKKYGQMAERRIKDFSIDKIVEEYLKVIGYL